MIPLSGRALSVDLDAPLERRVWKLVDRNTLTGRRHGCAYIVDPPSEQATNGSSAVAGEPPDGFELYLFRSTGSTTGVRDPQTVSASNGDDAPFAGRSVQLPAALHYLSGEDVLALSDDGSRLRVMWRHWSNQNSVLLTERCDNFCLMCSQPPKEANDDWLLDNARELIRLLPRHTEEIGFTGGEPTFYGAGLIELLALVKNLLPGTAVHVLSNGRRFSDLDFALAWAGIDNPNLMVGIPIYSSESTLHNYVVQARGAFDETVRGILNLAQLEQRIEIRVVIHKQTAPALVEIAEFIARNLPFVEQVALMGLEMTGFARANMETVWIDPIEYAPALTEAANVLDAAGVRTMIYNHQLCLLEPAAWRFAVKSISDWKNEYHPECLKCTVADRCGGFFYSAKYRISDHIRAIGLDEDVAARSADVPAQAISPQGWLTV